MGKKARKTRWRALSISGPQSDSESQTGEAPKRYAQHNPRASTPWHHQQNGHYPHSNGLQAGRYHSSHSTPTRHHHHHNGYYASKSTRSSSTASDNKITFNEDEYTRITTPRQDVLFKKGYLSKPKPYLQQHHQQQQQQQQLTSAGNSTGDGTPDHQSADGAEVGDYEFEHTSPFIFPNGFIDQNGICYINGVHGYEPYPQMMMYNPATVCYPPPYMNHRVKRYSTDSMTESMSPNNECTDGPSSAGPEFNPVYGFVYPDGVGDYVPYNELPADSQEVVGDVEEAPGAEPAAEDGARRLKKRRRRRESRRESDEEAGTTEEEDGSEEVDAQKKIIQEVAAKQEVPASGAVEVLEVSEQPKEATAQSDTHTSANDTLVDTDQLTNHPSAVAATIADHSDTQHQSDNTITHKESKTEDTTMTATTSIKYSVDAEEFVPRAYRAAIPMASFMPVSLMGDMFTGAFIPPPPGVAINFMPAGHYEEFLPHGYAPIPQYMEPRYSRKPRNNETVTSPVENTVAVTADDKVETSTADVATESNGEASTAPDTSVTVTDSSIVTAEQSNTARAEIATEASTDSCTADQTTNSTSTNTHVSTKVDTGADTAVKSTIPQCNAIDIAKIVSKLEQAAKDQQRIEQEQKQQPQQREKRQNVPKPERRGVRPPQQQQQQKRSEEHGPTHTAQEEVVTEKKVTETQSAKSKVLTTSTTEPSISVTKDVPNPVITSTTSMNAINYSDKLKCTTRPSPLGKKPTVVLTNQKQHTCPRLERSNRHPDNAQTGRKHTNVAYNRTDSASDSSTQSIGHTTKYTSANSRTEAAKRTEHDSKHNTDKKTSRAELRSACGKPVQSAAVTSTDQWISVSSKKKRKGRHEQTTSPIRSGSDQDITAEHHNIEQVEQIDTVELITNDVASESAAIVQDTTKEPTKAAKPAETEPQTIVQDVDAPIVESTTSSVTSTPRSQEFTTRKTKNNKKQSVRKRIIINDEQLTLEHQQQQQPHQIEPQQDVKPTAVPEVTLLPVKETTPVVNNKLPEIVEPVIIQEPIIPVNTETSSDDAKTIASDELSTVTMTTTTDSEQTAATTTSATVASSKQKRRKKKTKTAAATVNKSALDSTSDEWTLTADEDTTCSSIAMDSDESSKTNVEVSLEIDRMIQRGLFANLEEKLKSFNPTDSFIHSATLDIIKVAPPPPSSLDNGTKYGALGNFKNFDFSGILLSGMQQSRQHHQRVVGNATLTGASPVSTGSHQQQQHQQQQQNKLTPAGNDTFEHTFTSPEANTPTLLVNGCSESLLEAEEEYATPSATTPAAADDAPPTLVQVLEDLPPVSTHVSRLPITRAVKEWMHRTRETTPEVEIFKRPNEIRHELLVLATDALDDLDEDVARRAVSTSRESSAVPDLLDCWEEASVGEVREQPLPAEAVEHSGTATEPTSAGHIEQGEDALEMYESVYGKNADYLSIRREVDECSRQSTAPGTVPRHARDGGLPYRAICCTVM